MNTQAKKQQWNLHSNPVMMPGCANGINSPSIILHVIGAPCSQVQRESYWRQLCTLVPALQTYNNVTIVTGDSFKETLLWIMQVTWSIQRVCNLPIYQKGKLEVVSTKEARMCIPALAGSEATLVKVLSDILHLLEFGFTNIDTYGKQFTDRLNQLGTKAPVGSNMNLFIKAANKLSMPYFPLSDSTYQFGIGSNSRWLNSTFTDKTPLLAHTFSKDKAACASLLRAAGLPGAQHFICRSEEEAVIASEKLGFPLVVKPSDKDGGQEVHAGLINIDEVRKAYKSVRKISKSILVEKHFSGRDYRLSVFHGEVIWGIERVPGGVTGDGNLRIGQLIEQLNSNPRRGTNTNSALKHLEYDEEAQILLERMGYTLNTVPAKGEFIRLRRAANIASGGTPIGVYEHIHPDNADLAVRASECLGLDIAGVDLLVTDIKQSWLETGALICEVNGQPTMGQTTSAHLYEIMLQRLVRNNGNIPTIYLLGAEKPSEWCNSFQLLMNSRGLRAGCVDSNGLKIDGKVINPDIKKPFSGGRALSLHRDVDAMIVSVNDSSILATGLPFSNSSCLVIAGNKVHIPHNHGELDKGQLVSSIISLLLNSANNTLFITTEGKSLLPEQKRSLETHNKGILEGSISDMSKALMHQLFDSEGKKIPH